MNTSVFTLADGAKLLNLPAIVLQRAAVRGQLKVDHVQGKPFVRMANLEAFVAAKDDPMPEHSSGWFTENDLNYLVAHAQHLVAKQITPELISAAEVQAEYNKNRSLKITRSLVYHDPSGDLKKKPSSVLRMPTLAKKFDEKYPTLIHAVFVSKARYAALRICNSDRTLELQTKSALEKLYTPGMFQKVLNEVQQLMSRIFATQRIDVKIRDNVTGSEVILPVAVDVTLSPSVLPSVDSVMKLAF